MRRRRTTAAAAYHRLFRWWFAFGFPAFAAVLAIFWLMITRPAFHYGDPPDPARHAPPARWDRRLRRDAAMTATIRALHRRLPEEERYPATPES
jgi:hypothetical protein